MDSLITAKSVTGHDIPAHVMPDGSIRLLGLNREHRPLLAAPGWRQKVGPTIPRSEWASRVYNRVRSDVPILNQGQVGSCNAHGATTSVMKARAKAGQAFQLLSASFLYAQMNGGVDRGSNPDQAIDALLKTGVALDSQVPEGFYRSGQIDQAAYQTALRFCLDPASYVALADWDEIVSAGIENFDIFFSLLVKGDWNTLDANGCPPAASGYGNHVICDDDRLSVAPDGTILFGARNSWDTNWGDNGTCNVREAHFANQPDIMAYGIKYPGQDPQDVNLVPAAA